MHALRSFLFYFVCSATASATPVVYTLEGDTQNGGTTGFTFTAQILVDTNQEGRSYVDGARQDLPGTYFGSLVSYQDNQGNSLSLPAEADTQNGHYSVQELRGQTGILFYTSGSLSAGELFQLETLSNWGVSEWAVGQYMEFNIYSPTYPQPGAHFANITAVSSVPLPTTLPLMASALASVFALRKRFKV